MILPFLKVGYVSSFSERENAGHPQNVPLVSVGRKCPGIQGVISLNFHGVRFSSDILSYFELRNP